MSACGLAQHGLCVCYSQIVLCGFIVCIAAAPLSEISLFFSGLRQSYSAPVSAEDAAARTAEEETLVAHVIYFRTWRIIGELKKLADLLLSKCSDEIQDFYKTQVVVSVNESVAIALNSAGQDENDDWREARKLRITGYKCYSFKTYRHNAKANWDSRYQSVYHSTFMGCAATRHGKKYEGFARDAYRVGEKVTVFETGAVVRSELPWLGYSPDGIVLDKSGHPVKVIEIKCPVDGVTVSAEEFLERKVVKSLDVNGNMRRKCEHNGQMHLGMLLLGLSECDYINYSSEFKNYLCVSVPFQEDFALELGVDLCHVYFEELLPRMFNDFQSLD